MKLAALFSDHAVMQRDIAIPVWGWTTPHATVSVTLGDNRAMTKAGADGKFLVRLAPMSAGGPYRLEARGAEAAEVAVAKDVWVGEVWVASGQSNMQYTLGDLGRVAAKAAAESADPGLRMITIPRLALAGRQADVVADWKLAGPQDAASFSAVGYFFAKKLRRELGVAVGIVDSSWGGTNIETWTRRETLVRNPDVGAWVAQYEAKVNTPEYVAALEAASPLATYPHDPGNDGEGKGWAMPDLDDSPWRTMNLPGNWKKQGIESSGVVWFRLAVNVPKAWAGRDLALRIGAVDKQDTTYFNGERIGATGTGVEECHWNVKRDYTVPGRLVKAGRNVVAVRAYSFVYDAGLIGPADVMALSPRDDQDAKPISLAGAWRYQVEHDLGIVTPASPPLGPGNPNSPYILNENMIAPLIPYAIRGAIWYQGESNVRDAAAYRRLMVDLVRDWRHAWGQGDFTFLITQLANYMAPETYQPTSTWALLREAQLQATAEPGVGMAVIIDIGEELDIHPQNKWDVGGRLAAAALAMAYGKPVIPSGPTCSGLTIERNRIRLRFAHVGGGLVAQGGPLRTFVVAGLDRAFREANAVIDGDTVLVDSPLVPTPMAVRYAWADNPRGCNLYNAAGLPASPFRTDTW
jgi:sialate O-acetylesterase